jgi:hypothetical protein
MLAEALGVVQSASGQMVIDYGASQTQCYDQNRAGSNREGERRRVEDSVRYVEQRIGDVGDGRKSP